MADEPDNGPRWSTPDAATAAALQKDFDGLADVVAAQAETNQWRALAAVLMRVYGRREGTSSVCEVNFDEASAVGDADWELVVEQRGDRLHFVLRPEPPYADALAPADLVTAAADPSPAPPAACPAAEAAPPASRA